MELNKINFFMAKEACDESRKTKFPVGQIGIWTFYIPYHGEFLQIGVARSGVDGKFERISLAQMKIKKKGNALSFALCAVRAVRELDRVDGHIKKQQELLAMRD